MEQIRELVAKRRRRILGALGIDDEEKLKEFAMFSSIVLSTKLHTLLGSGAVLSFGRYTKISPLVALIVHDITFRKWLEKGTAVVLDPTCGKNILFDKAKDVLAELGIRLVQCDVSEDNACGGEVCDVFDAESMKARLRKEVGSEWADLIVYDPPYFLADSTVPGSLERRLHYFEKHGRDTHEFFSKKVAENFKSLSDEVLVKCAPQYVKHGDGTWDYMHPLLEFREFFEEFELVNIFHVVNVAKKRRLALKAYQLFARLMSGSASLNTVTYFVHLRKR